VAEQLTVDEASVAYESAMRNPAPVGPGVCALCRTFIDPEYLVCQSCHWQPEHLDAIVPITYSVELGQMHTALRGYKDHPPAAQSYAMTRLAGILWRFLREHGSCVARATGVTTFDVVTTVPSSTPERDEERKNLRTIVGWCDLINDRFRRVLRPTGEALQAHRYEEDRYQAVEDLAGQDVLLIDDTWTSGANAQSAAYALREAGANRIGLVVIGRHINPDFQPTPGETCQERWGALPVPFNWATCAMHDRS
jgi:predicted amidophosphoribosyltransferase